MWFSRRRCPLTPEDERWVHGRVRWLIQALGEDRVHSVPVMLPTRECFPHGIEADDASISWVFQAVCEWAQVDPFAIRLELYDDPAPADARRLGLQPAGGVGCPLGTYDLADGPRIRISRENLRSQVDVLSTVAHEVAHHVLIAEFGVDPDEDDHEPLTDLATVFLGLGWFGAAACLQDRSWETGPVWGWEIGRHGYLPQPVWGYALAVFAWLRDERKPAWVRGLPGGITGPMRKGLAYLARTAGPGSLPHRA